MNRSLSRASGAAGSVPHSAQRVDAELLLSLFKVTTRPAAVPLGAVSTGVSGRGRARTLRRDSASR